MSRSSRSGPRRHPGAFRRVAMLAGCVSLAACAASGEELYNPSRLDAASLGRVRAICSQVMGLSPGESHFESCLETLSAEAAARSGSLSLARGRASCRAQGLQPDTPALAQCELGAPPAQAAPLLANAGPEPRATSSYWDASNAEIFRREQMSCARLGLEPAGSAFGGCVASLVGAMTSADMPPH